MPQCNRQILMEKGVAGMFKLTKVFALVLLVMTMAASTMAAQVWGPSWHGYYGPGWGWGPSYYWGAPFYPVTTGEVEIKTHSKTAQIYVDGGYVGTTEKFKHFDLDPGLHDIEIRDYSGNTIYKNRINV